jgi:hypothetical protein
VAAGVLGIPLQYLFALPELSIDRRQYFIHSVVKGQWTSWTLGLLLLPFWPYFQSIDSWPVVVACAAGLAGVFYGAVWLFTLESHHRQVVQRLMPV